MSKKILLVDDDPELADGVGEILRLYNYTVEMVNSAEDALQLLNDYVPDLIVCDYHLDGMTGVAFADALQQEERFAQIPFFLLTGMPRSDIQGNIAPERIIKKPFEIEPFLDTILQELS
ncbi:MAG: response regulator [Chloroflexota bacterium]